MSVLLLSPKPNILYRIEPQYHQLASTKSNGLGFGLKNEHWKQRKTKRNSGSFWPELFKPSSSSSSSSVAAEMEPVQDSEHFDQILAQAKLLSQPIVVDWMAAWCRKCIYLKPKLEKLATEYDTKLKFYYVDVNKVPQALVKRGNISKMPTIQLWKDGEMKAEVIGGHKAWLVIEEVREMINQFV